MAPYTRAGAGDSIAEVRTWAWHVLAAKGTGVIEYGSGMSEAGLLRAQLATVWGVEDMALTRRSTICISFMPQPAMVQIVEG